MTENPASTLRVSWRSIAIWLALAGLSLLGTIIIIIPVRNVDLLSTIALALAILAFVAQLLIFIAQTVSASQQNAQSLQINVDTRRFWPRYGLALSPQSQS
ncbi:hypothetical protein AB0C15_24385 [Micromonospora sp. NPDC048835]|uniref:hypothetical protein n=1 Tax=Micromonospora sp. NPDC048835 TaxID=3155147 RepID=UPI0033D439D9